MGFADLELTRQAEPRFKARPLNAAEAKSGQPNCPMGAGKTPRGLSRCGLRSEPIVALI
jgi:hypothetical protein